ncbi:MAG: helix-turn-helix transcriptional regulator [Hyphomicrobiaceae bacterium]
MNKRNSDVRDRFAQRLRAIRVPRGYKTARSFAEALEIDENRYTRYERAEVEPDLRLMMRICSLLGATPNDLLCDTIGAATPEFDAPYGFSERSAGTGYHAQSVQPAQSLGAAVSAPAPATNVLNDVRKAVGFQLAEAIATIEAESTGVHASALTPLEKLRRTVPIAARIEADAFKFLGELPDRLANVSVSSHKQAIIDRLIQELILAHKSGHNDND